MGSEQLSHYSVQQGVLVHMSNGWFVETRVPYDEHYVTLVGEAVYIFLYYEWAIICVLDYLEPGFRLKYCRGSSPMTSGRVSTLLKTASENYAGCKTVEKAEMESCSSRFESARQKRNALIHATPITSDDGSQILNYQGPLEKRIPSSWEMISSRALSMSILRMAIQSAALSVGGIWRNMARLARQPLSRLVADRALQEEFDPEAPRVHRAVR